jgi:hypothetical protein
MAKSKKAKRTQIQDLPVEERELGVEEASKVKGGAGVASTSSPPPPQLTNNDFFLKIKTN